MTGIHPTAVVSEKARLAGDVRVGPYTVIGDNVRIGPGTVIGPHVVIDGYTTIGARCEIFTGAVIGSRPQDLKYKECRSLLEIGDENIIREYCTFNPGTSEGSKTIVGRNNLFMAYSHVAHDCRVGNYCVFANNGTLAGHVTVYDRAVIGGLVAIHQFVRVGELSMIGGCSKVVQDIPPFSTCDGHPAVIFGLNLTGLRRNSFSRESIKDLKTAFKILFYQGHTTRVAMAELAKVFSQPHPELQILINFVQQSERGMSGSCRAKRHE